MAVVEVRNLTKMFGEFVAVDDVSFAVEESNFLILLGPSGCGKTTILRMIAGLEIPSSGEIYINDHLVFSSKKGIFVPARKRGVGLVFQSYALWPHMTVFENIAFGLKVKRLKPADIKQKVERVLDVMKLEGMAGRYPQEMSGGQQQRVALARMLVSTPDIFLMDEPLSNLDAKLRLEMRADIKNLHRETGATTVYVTHDQVEGMTMASEIAVLNQGIIEQMEEPKRVYHLPSSLFVADFIGSPKINKIEGITALAAEGGGGVEIEFENILLATSYRQISPGRKVVAAIRPENISLVTASGKNTLQVQVKTVLPAGAETILQVSYLKLLFNILLTRETDLEVGEKIYIYFPPEKILIFDWESAELLPCTF